MNILGLMSGNSCDGLDCCDVDINIDHNYQLKYKINKFSIEPYTSSEKSFLLSLRENEQYKIKKNKTILTEIYLNKINQFTKCEKFQYIACHGQTVHHIDKVISVQLLDYKLLYNTYNKPIIHNFRENDIKNGGNGAPLMPFLDWLLFLNTNENIVTLNIGRISNVTYIPKDRNRDKILGFDVGPGMNLVDKASKIFFNEKCLI